MSEDVAIKNTIGSYPAFPFECDRVTYAGLSKRECFAAMAMQGLCANSIPGSHKIPSMLALEAVIQADALIEALNK